MNKLTILFFLSFSLPSWGADQAINLLQLSSRNPHMNRTMITRASMSINKHDEITINLRTVRRKRHNRSCLRAFSSNKYCRVKNLSRSLSELSFNQEESMIYFNNTPCASVKDRRLFFGRKVTLTKSCFLKITNTRNLKKVELIVTD